MIKKSTFLLVIGLSTFFLFVKLGSTYLVNFDEAFYAVMAKEMVQRNLWHAITYQGGPFFGASPFYLWLEALWFRLFGLSAWGARFFAAASSLGTIILVYWYFASLGRSLFGALAGLVLLSTIKFLYLSRVGNLDATLTFFTTASIILLHRGLKSQRWLPLAGVTTGLAFLTKGLFGLWPLAVFILYTLLFQRKLLVHKSFSLCLILFGILVLPWQFLQIFLYGTVYLKNYFIGYMVGKLGSLPFWEHFWWVNELWAGLKLWFLFLGVVLALLFSSKELRTRLRFFCFALVVYFVSLSLMRTHFDWYLMPLYPLLAIIAVEALGVAVRGFSISLKLQNTMILIIFVFHLAWYQHLYFVPETTDAQMYMIREAQRYVFKEGTILLDDFYLPVALFYANIPVNQIRSTRDTNIGFSETNLNYYLSKGSVVLTNTTTEATIRKSSIYPLDLVAKRGELLLYKPR